ncbi:MAG: hypothetical protein IIC04_09110, partial [Proteobacteria bacterium]|nr:hypothetical protein [Pseudomonadota bacterium]
ASKKAVRASVTVPDVTAAQFGKVAPGTISNSSRPAAVAVDGIILSQSPWTRVDSGDAEAEQR